MGYGFNDDKSRCQITKRKVIQPQSGETYGDLVVRLWNFISGMESDAYKIIRIVFHIATHTSMIFDPPEFNTYGYLRPFKMNGFTGVGSSSVNFVSLHLAENVAYLPDYIISFASVYNENGTAKLSISNQYGKNVTIPTGENASSFEIHYTS